MKGILRFQWVKTNFAKKTSRAEPGMFCNQNWPREQMDNIVQKVIKNTGYSSKDKIIRIDPLSFIIYWFRDYRLAVE